MRRIKRARPSPALVVAVIALVAALAGGAVAGVAVTSLNKKERKQVRKISKRQANKRINKRESRLNVNSARSAGIATSADDADKLDGLDASSLVRAAGVSVANADESGDIASTAITAPTDGQLMIVASVDSSSRFTSGGGDGLDGFDCIIKLDDDPTELAYHSVSVGPDSNNEENCATNTLVPVGAGQHTVHFVGNSVSVEDVAFNGAELQVLFVPFDGSGS